ncbi:MAG: ATP-grasp domain-containing protein [Desulfobacterales bacterium]|nr:ATP-grasp domain-containing protein [Desulfobacterales bacterium]
MRLLITNSKTAQAYAALRALRPQAEVVIATTYGSKPLGIWPVCHASYSRMVDRRYPVPDPERDWHEGRIQPTNTPREQAYIDAIVKICERERIDTIFPTNDDRNYVFSKNKKRFEALGVLLPVPDYDVVIKPLDKYRTIKCAEAAGFPSPRTYLPESDADAMHIARELGPPWVVKPRFTTGSRGLAVVDRESDLPATIRRVRKHHGMPILQEYIPGKGKQNFYIVLDRNGQARSVFTPRVLRELGRVTRNLTAACLTVPLHPMAEQAVRTLRSMGWWGGATIQTKLDRRDGLPKIVEINPRLGTHLWFRTELGINEPLLCLQIAAGEPITAKTTYPQDCVLLQPLEDLISLPFELLDLFVYRLRTTIGGRKPIDVSNPPMTLRERLAAYKTQYLGFPSRIYSPYFRYMLSDPLPSLIWATKLLQMNTRASIQSLGR